MVISIDDILTYKNYPLSSIQDKPVIEIKNKVIKVSLIMSMLLQVFITKAQVNESDTSKFQLRASLTGNYQSGNVEVLNIKGKIDFSFSLAKNWVFKSQNSSLYQVYKSVAADKDISSRNYLHYKPNNKIYPFAIAYISTNYRRKIDTRYFVGSGATWQAINGINAVLKMSVSVVYESTKFNADNYNYSAYDGANKINIWRGTLYAGGWKYLLDKHIRFYYDAFWQPAFNDDSNFRTQIDIGADFPVWRGLLFNSSFTYTHENVVVKRIKQDDNIVTFGLAYNFRIVKNRNAYIRM
jgi:hypothetical protein